MIGLSNNIIQYLTNSTGTLPSPIILFEASILYKDVA